MKSKSLTTEETELNEALAVHGIRAWETDLAQLIIQLAGDTPSHILVPAIHKNRAEIRELFLRTLGGSAPPDLSDDPRELAEVARRHLRTLFLRARVGISGANFAVAETGTVAVVESEGNARMGLSAAELDEIDGALTGCAVAIAQTGTLVLDGREASGRRAITLVPDHHICLVRTEQIVGLVPEAIARVADGVRGQRIPITLVSGPSATSDIELTRVEGVHGPRHLTIMIAG